MEDIQTIKMLKKIFVLLTVVTLYNCCSQPSVAGAVIHVPLEVSVVFYSDKDFKGLY